MLDVGKKCCVYACKTNYSSEKLKSDKISLYRFPKDETEKENWIKAIPNTNLRISRDTVVCALHWPSDFDQKTRPPFGQVYHLVKYQHHLHHHDPQKMLVQANAALRKIYYQSFSVVMK